MLTFTAETILQVSQTLLEAAGTPPDLAEVVSQGAALSGR